MELIYMNNNFEELGVLQDYTLDLAYGTDENDFEIKTPSRELQQGYYWKIVGTEYGGRVDEIEFQNNEAEGVYRGRSWSGILDSFTGIQLQPCEMISFVEYSENDTDKNNYVIVEGTPKELLTQMLVTDLGLNVGIMEDSYDEDEIKTKVLATQPLGSMLVEIFHQFNMKIVFGFDDKLMIGVKSAIDYTEGQYFDSSQYSLTATSSTKIPNHLVGVHNAPEHTFVKHIYFDANHNIQPYYEIDTTIHQDAPLNNFEYERATGTKQVTGLNEVVELIEGGSMIERYDVVSELKGVDDDHPFGTEGNVEYANGVPYNWNDRCYEDYYYYDKDDDKYKNFELEYEYTPLIPSSISDDAWRKTFQNYFVRSLEPDPQTGEYTYTQLTSKDVVEQINSYKLLRTKPWNWNTNYADYYYRYTDPQGIKQYEKVTAKTIKGQDIPATSKKAPSGGDTDWANNKGSYKLYWYDNRYFWDVFFQIKVGGKWKNQPPNSARSIIQDFDKVAYIGQGALKDRFRVFDDLSKVKFNTAIYKYVKNENGKVERKLVKEQINLAKAVGKQNFTDEHKYVQVTERSRFKVCKRARYQHNKMFTTLDEYCRKTGKKLNDIKYKPNTYWWYTGDRQVVPDFKKDAKNYGDKSGFYDAVTTIEPPSKYTPTKYKQEDKIKPLFKQGEVYIKVEDAYSNLCEAMLKKYNEIVMASTKIEPRLDTETIQFDVGDIVGGIHPITKEEITNKVTKKIVNATPFKIDIDYEIG